MVSVGCPVAYSHDLPKTSLNSRNMAFSSHIFAAWIFFKNTYSDFIWNWNQEKLDLVKISNTKLAILFASNGGTAFPT